MNTMIAGIDAFNFDRGALLKSAYCFDLTEETSCTGFIIEGAQPAGTDRRIVFSIDDKLFKFGNAGLIPYTDRGDFSDIILNGNTVAELLALDSVPEFVGKKVYPVIALYAAENAQLPPKIKIALKVNSFNDRYIYDEISPIFDLSPNAKIFDFAVDKFLNGYARATITARVFDGFWSDFLPLENFNFKSASKIQFKINYLLTTLDGSDFAKVNAITCYFISDSDFINSTAQNIYSLPQDFYSDLNTAYLLVNHSELLDSTIKAYVNLSKPKIRRQNIFLGNSTGSEQTLYLQFEGVVDRNIAHDSLHIDLGGKTFYDFDFDTEKSSITLNAPAGQNIFASYDAAGYDESWREMELDFTRNDGGYFATRFIYRGTDSGNRVAAVKIVLTRLSGGDSIQLGVGNGSVQSFYLNHRAVNLACTGSWIYDDQIIKVQAPRDEPIFTAYDWAGSIPTVYSYIAGFC